MATIATRTARARGRSGSRLGAVIKAARKAYLDAVKTNGFKGHTRESCGNICFPCGS